jgi:two-component system, OmpR family, phosphate regulon sensor histidine kinase PhoR
LIDNGLKYTPAGGLVRIGLAANGDGAVVTVRDTGAGIRDSALPHIFERFYCADESRNHEGGSGLGLSIAQWIAQCHHAEIVAESTPGGGSVFSVHFSGSVNGHKSLAALRKD